MKKCIFFLVSFIALLCFSSCQKNDEKIIDNSVDEEIVEVKIDSQNLEPNNLTSFDENVPYEFSLDEPLVFSDKVDETVLSKMSSQNNYAVVANDVCFLLEFNDDYDESYSFNDGKNIDDVFKRIEKIPCGTIVQIEKILSKNTDYNSLIYYQETYNWFYKIKFAEKEGFVFGGDLTAFSDDWGSSITETVSVSNLYKLDGNPPKDFFPIIRKNGRSFAPTFISDKVKTSLEKNNLAFEKVRFDDYYLSIDEPDDMISLYASISSRSGSKTPIFVTTDFLAHCQHLFFDRMLQKLEEEQFTPRLLSLVDAYLGKLSVYTQDINDKEILKIAEKAKDYLTVAKYFISKSDVNPPIALESLSANCQKEISKIKACSGMDSSAIFPSYIEDYSQYKPRGHYTKSETLKNYFIAQMWFGRINFIMSKSKDDKSALNDVTKEMAPVALLLIDLTSKDEQLFSDWQYLFDPMTKLIGDSDDLSFYELCSLWKEQKVKSFSTWIKSEDNLNKFFELCHEKLNSPAIAGNSVLYAPAEDGSKPPMGWKLFGQRFTYDSFIHHLSSSPRLFGRMMVSGLDIMAAFGSDFAHELLKDEFTDFSDFSIVISNFKNFFDSKDSSFWKKNYYNSVLKQIKSLANFEVSDKFYFTKSPLWNLKSLSSSLGTWAELRHDTILYLKQSYAEKGGCDDLEPTYRKKELKQLISYIEPNEEFFKSSIDSIEILNDIDRNYKVLSSETKEKLNSLSTIYYTCLDLVQKEKKGIKLTNDDDKWIRTIPNKLATVVLPMSDTYAYGADSDSFKMAVVADVFTNAETSSVLEVGVAMPKRVYVALNDVNGKRIAIGYTLDYCEFVTDMNRLTDEDWKQIVYRDGEDLTSYKPNWLIELEQN